jgi:hypothetical protein
LALFALKAIEFAETPLTSVRARFTNSDNWFSHRAFVVMLQMLAEVGAEGVVSSVRAEILGFFGWDTIF